MRRSFLITPSSSTLLTLRDGLWRVAIARYGMQGRKLQQKSTNFLWIAWWSPSGNVHCFPLHEKPFIIFCCRNEIASCEEMAYESLPLKDAATLLFFRNQSDLLKFAEQVWSLFQLFQGPWTHRFLLAWLADWPYRWINHLYEEKWRKGGDTQTENNCSILSLR